MLLNVPTKQEMLEANGFLINGYINAISIGSKYEWFKHPDEPKDGLFVQTNWCFCAEDIGIQFKLEYAIEYKRNKSVTQNIFVYFFPETPESCLNLTTAIIQEIQRIKTLTTWKWSDKEEL